MGPLRGPIIQSYVPLGMEPLLKIFYVDAENIGLSAFDAISFSVLDRVFVFTNSEQLKSACQNALITCLSGYSNGQNQADFYIIAHLSNVLSHLSKLEKKAIEFHLHSKDQALWKAFEFQCNLSGVKSYAPNIALEVEVEVANVIAPVSSPLLEQKILKLMSKPITSVEIEAKLKVTKAEFTRTFNLLIKSERIKRQEKSKKNWVLNKNT